MEVSSKRLHIKCTYSKCKHRAAQAAFMAKHVWNHHRWLFQQTLDRFPYLVTMTCPKCPELLVRGDGVLKPSLVAHYKHKHIWHEWTAADDLYLEKALLRHKALVAQRYRASRAKGAVAEVHEPDSVPSLGFPKRVAPVSDMGMQVLEDSLDHIAQDASGAKVSKPADHTNKPRQPAERPRPALTKANANTNVFMAGNRNSHSHTMERQRRQRAAEAVASSKRIRLSTASPLSTPSAQELEREAKQIEAEREGNMAAPVRNTTETVSARHSSCSTQKPGTPSAPSTAEAEEKQEQEDEPHVILQDVQSLAGGCYKRYLKTSSKPDEVLKGGSKEAEAAAGICFQCTGDTMLSASSSTSSTQTPPTGHTICSDYVECHPYFENAWVCVEPACLDARPWFCLREHLVRHRELAHGLTRHDEDVFKMSYQHVGGAYARAVAAKEDEDYRRTHPHKWHRSTGPRDVIDTLPTTGFLDVWPNGLGSDDSSIIIRAPKQIRNAAQHCGICQSSTTAEGHGRLVGGLDGFDKWHPRFERGWVCGYGREAHESRGYRYRGWTPQQPKCTQMFALKEDAERHMKRCHPSLSDGSGRSRRSDSNNTQPRPFLRPVPGVEDRVAVLAGLREERERRRVKVSE